jgi:hypothetical protein
MGSGVQAHFYAANQLARTELRRAINHVVDLKPDRPAREVIGHILRQIVSVSLGAQRQAYIHEALIGEVHDR